MYKWGAAQPPSEATNRGFKLFELPFWRVLEEEKMGSRILFVLFLCALPAVSAQETLHVTISIDVSATVAETDDSFVCATLDWWPPEKCNYNDCPWGQASVLNLDLNNPILAKAIQAFKPLRIRIGGTLQNRVFYGVAKSSKSCLPFAEEKGALFGFSEGCLRMKRWDELNNLFKRTGAIVTFGLNALHGRNHMQNSLWGGAWNSSNARKFIKYTVSKGYRVDSWELGNELSGNGIGASVDADLYGKDLKALKSLLDKLYNKSSSQALLLAPGGFFDRQWYSQLLQVSGPGVVNAMTHHIYNLGGGDDDHIAYKILDPHYLSQIAQTYRELQHTIRSDGSWSSAWVSEAGGVYNSGRCLVSNTFINSFWYLDQLGMASKYNTKVYCRQSLIGGNYGLLDTTTFIPNPDYYSALLWHRLMGKGVLSTNVNGSSFLRAYAHCSKDKAGISLLLINLSNNTQFITTVEDAANSDLGKGNGAPNDGYSISGHKGSISWFGTKTSDGTLNREEYHLTAKDADHLKRTMLLNGKHLVLADDGSIPALEPANVSFDSAIVIAPLSIAFVVFPNLKAQACV